MNKKRRNVKLGSNSQHNALILLYLKYVSLFSIDRMILVSTYLAEAHLVPLHSSIPLVNPSAWTTSYPTRPAMTTRTEPSSRVRLPRRSRWKNEGCRPEAWTRCQLPGHGGDCTTTTTATRTKTLPPKILEWALLRSWRPRCLRWFCLHSGRTSHRRLGSHL